ncbi:MAG: BT_3928 family protein [Bacteroidales bacterium]|jgi:uncharacterized membrane protein YphA (DoxX/SURF4 family)
MALNNNILKTITGWAIIFITVFSAYLIVYFEKFNLTFLLLLFFELALAVRYRKIFSPAMIRVIQVLLGLLFIFSGSMKGVDPLGTAYRVEDYLIAYGTPWMIPATLILSFILNAAEFVLGTLLIFNIKPKLTSWLVILMMGLFTLTTLNDAINNPVPDCGCFGDAIIMSNWQTFYKNLVINVFVLVIFLEKNKIKASYKNRTEWALGIMIIFFFIGFEYFNYQNLPLIDFMPWKVGNKMFTENPLPVKHFLTYKNKISGEQKEYLSPDFPYNDSTWLKNWEFVSQRTEDPNLNAGNNLAIIDFNGNDITTSFLRNPDFNFIVVAWDMNETDKKSFPGIISLFERAKMSGFSFICLTASIPEQIDAFKKRNHLPEDLEFFNADDVPLKTMVRSNPGLILMKNGEVLGKWSHNCLPDWKQLNDKFLKKRSNP